MKTQTAPTSSLISSSLPQWRHDVFLSFYGKDTRNNFTAHLYTTLKDKSIFAFRDDEKLERGRCIAPVLLKAIEESKYAIVVLSRNYAFSSWCLLELAKIVECMETTGLTVLPIFYHVSPSHVRDQTYSFAEAFAEHEKDPKIVKEDVQTWKTALRKVGNISGWDLRGDRDESKAIQDIVGKILSKLNSIVSTSCVSKDLIGIASRVKELECLCLNNRPDDDVHFVGIWGMGGIGKTTLARAFYDRFSSQFEASSFIANVRERTGKDGLIPLQNELLSHILMERNIDIKDVDRGKNTISLRLCYKKVLVILDDVDKSEQLEALANERNWFGPGSSIIITTRNERLLIEHGLTKTEIYRAKGLDNDEALQLFSWKAFKKELPPEDFVGLSKQIIHYAKGHPLALKVLGSFLFEREVDFWESAVSRLKANPDGKIMDTLKISFDGLEEKERNLFLDIACFYKGEDRYHVKSILERFDYDPNIGIDVLISKSLITESGTKLWMHDLLEDMGREIVRLESPEDPGRRSRLWHDEDILRVLKSNSGTKRIQGIVLNSPPQEELHLNSDVFSKLKSLRLLNIRGNVHLSQDLSYLSTELRDMAWHGYPLKSWPPGFPPDKLVELNMCCSHIGQPWQGIKSLHKLKLVNLSNSRYLMETPDFTGAPNLERLILRGCTKLLKLHSSVGDLRRLIVLNLKYCTSLRSLPCYISWDFLEELILSGCSRLEKLPESVGNLKRLSQLHLDGCCKLDKMPEDLGNVERLEELDISGTAIRQVPSSFLRLQNLKMLNCQECSGLPAQSLLGLLFGCFLPSCDIGFVLPDSFSGLRCLNKLNLSFCHLEDGAIPSDLSGLSSLLALDLSGNDFTLLPESISQLPKLRVLFLRRCIWLRSLPELPSNIVNVAAEDCISLKEYSNEISGIISDESGLSHVDFKKNGTALVVTGKLRRQSKHSIMSGTFSLPAAQGKLMNERTIKANIDLARVIGGGSRGVGIPMWFQNQRMGSSITIRLHQDMDDSRKWLGCALYFVFEIYDLESWESTDQEDYEQHVFHFDTDEGRESDENV
ncbi:hypothetical protein F2P56_012244 [Juglans regia]|uniref:ADP-ribosyl cyclase/cyclic ADP-ribose hydrolase n=1 Tax=Juglans regia TaxID=51240 RepID=A0A833XIH2_JUGRE|nr:hypothetical protein F2P56_012244 [Juglans regia]